MTAHIKSINGISGGLLAYGTIFDNLLGIPEVDLRGLINLHGILYEALITNDSFLMTNPVLQSLLQSPDGSEWLKNGIIILLRRDTVDSYEKFRLQCEEKKMSGLCATPEFAKWLDDQGKAQPFPMAQVGANFKAMNDKVLERSVLIKFGLGEKVVESILAKVQHAKANGVNIAVNSFFYDHVCPYIEKSDADLLMELVRAPYALNLPSVLGTGVVGHHGFRGDQILRSLVDDKRKVGIVEVVSEQNASESIFKDKIKEELVNWLLSAKNLTTMTPTELAIVRSTSERFAYLQSLRIFLEEPTQTSWSDLWEKMNVYLLVAATNLYDARSRNSDPKIGRDRSLLIEGGDSLKIVGDMPVKLTGVEGASIDKLQVIGRSITLPVYKDESGTPLTPTMLALFLARLLS